MGEVFLASPLLTGLAGAVHAFSTRHGGVSPAPYDSLNLGYNVGDDRERVRENHARFIAAAGLPGEKIRTVGQEHGDNVVVIEAAEQETARVAADALVTKLPGVAIGVRTADCVPLLCVDPGAGVVAAIHAGWRGVVAGVVLRALDAMERLGARREKIRVAFGPAIRCDAFEVGPEVVEQFERAGLLPEGGVRGGRADRSHLELTAILRGQLTRAGIDPAHLDDLGVCTHARADLCFSFRRDGRVSGRHLSAIALRP